MILLGGSLGALARYIISLLPYKFINTTLPLGTMLVNILGSFLIGLLWSIGEKFSIEPQFRIFIFTGFLGAFTTFSTYSLETFRLLQSGEFKVAILNILSTPIIAFFFLLLGYYSIKLLYKIF